MIIYCYTTADACTDKKLFETLNPTIYAGNDFSWRGPISAFIVGDQ